jgi:putative OmpL-like beta-barrel porin-2
MKNTFGVCLGLLAMGLSIAGAPMARAQNRMAANGPSGATETSATTASAPAASSSADLHQRIDALKAELDDLNKELAAEKDGDPATSAATPQDQGPTPATPAPAAAPAAAAAAPMPLPTPSMTAPLATGLPHEIAAGPFGKIDVTGVLSGMGWTEGNYVLGDSPTHFDLSNAQVFVQKTTGWFQFYAQGGAYNLPALGASFIPTKITSPLLYGPFPVGYLKLVKGNFNVEVGALPTLIGAEYTFSFENMNIERGLLWGLEPAISRGIQLNETYKKLTLAFSWNDGFYSSRYTSLSGSLAYAFNASNTLSFAASGNAGAYNRIYNGTTNPAVTPVNLNNSTVYNLIYTYTHGNWMINPYFQYTDTKTNASIGIPQGAHTSGGALLVNYNFKHGISLAGRAEYVKSSGSTADPNEINLLGFGPGSGAYSFTLTPTYVKDAFFIRGDFSIVHATNTTPAFAVFGPDGTKLNQPRGVLEVGFLF